MNTELLKSHQNNIELDRDLNIAEAKVECVYLKKMDEEDKVKALSAELQKSNKQIKGFVTTKSILKSKIQGMDKRLDEYRQEVESKEECNVQTLKEITLIKSAYKQSIQRYQQINIEYEDLRKINTELERKLKEYNKRDAVMYDMINAVYDDDDNGHKKCFRFKKLKKQSKKMLLIDKLKLMFEEKKINV